MLVYIAQLLLSYLVYGVLRDPEGFNFPQSKLLSDGLLLPMLISDTRLHVGIVFALLASLGGWLYLSRSIAASRLRVGGMAPAAARYAGFSSRKTLWSSMLICGALSGLAGACEVLGPMGQLTPSVSPGYGFAAIIVAFVGRFGIPWGGFFPASSWRCSISAANWRSRAWACPAPSLACFRASCCSPCSLAMC